MAGRTAVAAVAVGGFTALRRGTAPPAGARTGLGLLRPPGSLGEAEFLASCIRCTRCADACEKRCILLLGPEAGRHQGTPYIMPVERACNLCLACGKACPAGAILPLEEAGKAEMGLAVVDERLCVSHAGTGVCGACFTACPLRGKAITQGMRNAPEIHEDQCTGCGLCEEFCIVDDREGLRAIQVTTSRRWFASTYRTVA